MFQLPPEPLQVRSLSRPLLVERVAGLVAAGDLRAPVLPALAVLQVGGPLPHWGQGLGERAGLVGEVLARAAPAYSGQVRHVS